MPVLTTSDLRNMPADAPVEEVNVLIPEAKARQRLRLRVVAASFVLFVASVGGALWATSHLLGSSAARAHERHPSALAHIPMLNDAAAIGRLDRLFNTPHATAIVTITCGWNERTHRRIGHGTYQVDLRRTTFGLESDPAKPSAGSVPDVSLEQWSASVRTHGWQGYLYLWPTQRWLSNGPGVGLAICSGFA